MLSDPNLELWSAEGLCRESIGAFPILIIYFPSTIFSYSSLKRSLSPAGEMFTCSQRSTSALSFLFFVHSTTSICRCWGRKSVSCQRSRKFSLLSVGWLQCTANWFHETSINHSSLLYSDCSMFLSLPQVLVQYSLSSLFFTFSPWVWCCFCLGPIRSISLRCRH